MRWRRTGPRAERPIFGVEPMEPRILLSADVFGVDAGLIDPGADGLPAWDLEAAADWTKVLGSDDPSVTSPSEPTTARQPIEIVFLDAGVEYGEQFLADLTTGNEHRITGVYILDTDGVAQIAQILAQQQQSVDAIHILSHGSAVQIQLGSATPSTGSLDGYAGQLNDWGSAFADTGDILIYGCDLAADEQGQALVDAIGVMTGADVAASVDQTGSAAQGGDWDLEHQVGMVETAVFAPGEFQIWQSPLASFYLDRFDATAFDGDDGTLSWSNDWQEIGDANNGAGFGYVSVWTPPSMGEQGLYLWAEDDVGAARQADLSGATQVTLSFDWAMIKATDSGDQARLQISTDGSSWTTLDTFDGPLDQGTTQSASYDISPFIDSDTQIRFETVSGFSSNEVFFVDNVRIDLSSTAPSSTTLTPVKDTYIAKDADKENFGGSDVIRLDESGGGLGDGHVLLQFYFSSIPPGATILSVVLQMETSSPSGDTIINAY